MKVRGKRYRKESITDYKETAGFVILAEDMLALKDFTIKEIVKESVTRSSKVSKSYKGDLIFTFERHQEMKTQND